MPGAEDAGQDPKVRHGDRGCETADVSADDRVASVSRAAVRAHERAALIHSEAADLYARLVRSREGGDGATPC